MNLHQEFHEHLQAGRLTEAISLVVGQLVELKITTTANSGRLHTTVDLLSGQITNTVDPAFFSDKSSQKLLEFHTNQIAATSQVVRDQLHSLQDLLQVLTPSEKESIKLMAIAASEQEASVPVNSLPAVPAAIISAPTSETLPVALAETIPAVPTPSIVEKPAEISAPQPISHPASPLTKAPENLAISQPEPQIAVVSEQPSISQPLITQVPDDFQSFQLAADSDITATDLEPLPAAQTPPTSPSSSTDSLAETISESQPSQNEDRSPLVPATRAEQGRSKLSERVKLPDTPPVPKPESRAVIASGLAAALAQTSALDPSEAAAIPNKFDQALRSAGVRSTTEEDLHPFATSKSVIEPMIEQPVIEQPTELIPRRELIDLLRESEDDWDEWLLEEDNILSELSDVTKDKLPDLESHWLPGATSSSVSIKSAPADWEEFMPEYPEVSAVASKNHANVERFRQNLVNDPQLMSELLAELDDLEEMEEGKPKL